MSKVVKNLTVGDVVRFDYVQGDEHSYNVIGRVMSIRDTDVDPILSTSRFYNRIQRSRYLIGVVCSDGAYRCFYNKVANNASRVSLIGRVCLWLRGVTFPKFNVV